MVDKIISASWLEKHIDNDKLVILDASIIFNKEETIVGARHFDIAKVFSDPDSPFPNTFPSLDHFEKESRNLGICNDHHIVVYDDKGIFTSPRVWWMFTVMGHSKISVLDGGLPAWKAQGFRTTQALKMSYKQGDFKAQYNAEAIKRYEDIVSNIASNSYQVIDARSQNRFLGTSPEPRSHIQSGHIKHSLNLPYTDVLENGKFKSKSELKSIFKGLSLGDTPIIVSCGSGITACIVLLAYALISYKTAYIYDGSWTEWAEKEGLFVQK